VGGRDCEIKDAVWFQSHRAEIQSARLTGVESYLLSLFCQGKCSAQPAETHPGVGAVIHACNPSTREKVAGGSRVPGQPGLQKRINKLKRINKQHPPTHKLLGMALFQPPVIFR
jgi:hypothetical protein